MPLYELVCITKHHTSLTPLQTLIRSSAALIADHGGVVRHLDHWGTRNLPQRMKVGKRRGGGGGGGGGLEDGSSSTGDYFTLRFDCNPPTLSALNSRLRLDPSVLRFTTLKVGSTLDQVATSPAARGENKTIRFRRDPPDALAPLEMDLDQAREVMSRSSGSSQPLPPQQQQQQRRRAWDEL
ncbi:hypothetical protein JCM8115_001185 [Rhodotorula mucilaginosa]|uniref:Ribosomal protein S6 n=1 Tax=Rhodotorula mucilaginosa TaxID=5537 RepID=A0A9P6VYG2_RHOMI|nr:hypothetical protein C6P46_006625 [Rhodotorula mucilaginosa]TKA50799.1 hypothetical protein B0A53_06158 [Rhodotorula sp. CCFEE 5036]